MAARLLVFLFSTIKSISIASSQLIYTEMPEVNGENIYEHLNYTYILNLCHSRDTICKSKSNDSVVCALRLKYGEEDFRTYNNSCHLFFSNMCDNPGDEYNIIQGGSCDNYLSTKRAVRRKANATEINNVKAINGSFNENRTIFSVGTTPNGIRSLNDTISMNTSQTVDNIEEPMTAFDEHTCPHSCPDLYSPVCVIVNMGQGKYFKYFTFANHCLGDMYYCKNSDQFGPPPDEEYENVRDSPLGWSYCGAYRYLQFARFSEVLSSMGHYGWLAGNQKYSHIMEPHERMPGYG